MKNFRQELRLFFWRARYWLSWPLWWLLEPRAETLCEDYTRDLIDEDSLSLEIKILERSIDSLEMEDCVLQAQIDDIKGEVS